MRPMNRFLIKTLLGFIGITFVLFVFIVTPGYALSISGKTILKDEVFVTVNAVLFNTGIRGGQVLSDSLQRFLSGFPLQVSYRLFRIRQRVEVNIIGCPVVKALMASS
jgi:hypothetical protein